MYVNGKSEYSPYKILKKHPLPLFRSRFFTQGRKSLIYLVTQSLYGVSFPGSYKNNSVAPVFVPADNFLVECLCGRTDFLFVPSVKRLETIG
jgi:hypothetical protein